jgi:hypothetical protein
MFRILLKELSSWLIETLVEHSVAATIETYLISQWEVLMADCIHGTSQDLIEAAAETDRLGWDSLLEGRISKQWLVVVSSFLRRSNKVLLPPSWGCQLINKLHNTVHKQWIYRNTFIHYRGSDGLTLPEHHDIINRMEEHAFTDPESRLPRHRFLLEMDIEALGSGPSTQRLLWLANVNPPSLHPLLHGWGLSLQQQLHILIQWSE